MARWLLALALACTGLHAMAQEDPPGRVARLNAQQGAVSFSPAGDDSWYDVIPNRPLTTGDRLWADRNSRAELFVGSAALRLDGNTAVEFTEVTDQAIRITIQQGTAQLRVRDDLSGQQVELDTGNLAFVIQQPGDYRVQVDPQADLTQVMVASGAGVAYGENGESTSVSARQQIIVNGRNLANAGTGPMPLDDGFERWVAERSRAEDASISARYVSRETVGYQQLDSFGDWQNDSDFGPVWYPRNVAADWAPYSDGYWVSVAPWGWTWVDNAPWGFAPFHYGRWAQVGTRWGWVPGRQQSRPVYSPALVGFVGGGRGGTAQVPIGGGRNGIGWFPLAPGEAWRPGYQASQRYVEQANRMALYNRAQQRSDFYANQRQQAVTVVPSDVFGRGPIARRDHIRMPEAAFAGVPVANAPGVAPPPQHFAPGIGSAPSGFMGRPVAAIPPPQWQQRDRQQQQSGYRPPQEWRQPQAFQQQQQQLGQAPQRGLAGPAPQQLQQQQVQQQQMQAQQQLQLQQYQQAVQQQQAVRQQQELQQRASQNQAVQQQQLQVQQQQQQQQALRQQQEMQQRAVQAQAQQQALAQQQAIAQHQALAQQQAQAMQQQQQAMQQRAQQMQQQQAAQQQQHQQQQRSPQGLPGEIRDGSRQRRLPGQSGGDGP